MALAKTLWTTIVDLVSTGQNVSDNLDTAFTNIDAAIDQIDANTAAIATLNESGLVVMSGTNLTAQSIATSATKVNLFDTKNVEIGLGVSGDVATHKATATLDGIYKVRFEAFVQYASNVDITWQMYKNGVAFGNSITLSGQGANVFPIVLITSTSFTANDYLELYATASATTDLTISQANGTLEKTYF